MKIYSDFPLWRTLQIVFDVAAVGIMIVAVWLGTVVTASIAVLADVGKQLEDAGADFKGAMLDAGDALGAIPFVGETVRAPFDAASMTGGNLEDAGQSTQSFILTTATIVGSVVALVIVVIVLWVWLKRRVGFMVRATEANRLSRLGDGDDVLALRALVNGSKSGLAKIGVHPLRAWRSGDQVVIAQLADLELREAGVRIAR